jgi:hypothetical protein
LTGTSYSYSEIRFTKLNNSYDWKFFSQQQLYFLLSSEVEYMQVFFAIQPVLKSLRFFRS